MKKLMNIVLRLLSLILASSLLLLFSCSEDSGNDVDPKSKKQQLTEYLVNKSGGWNMKSVNVPVDKATEAYEWDSFKLTVSNSNMTTSGHASGSEAVWPSGGWTMDDSGTKITRADNVVMTVISLTPTSFKVSFNVPVGTERKSRISALDGEYIFDLN